MRTYSTSQVVRLLELHPDWEFQAPQTREHYAQWATRKNGVSWIRFERTETGVPWILVTESSIDLRSDWTRVKPAKLERVKLGTFKTNASGNQDGLGLGLADAALRLYGMASNTTGTWTLYAVKEST